MTAPSSVTLPTWWKVAVGVLGAGALGLGAVIVLRHSRELADPWATEEPTVPGFQPGAMTAYVRRRIEPTTGYDYVLTTRLFPGLDERGREDRSQSWSPAAELHFHKRTQAVAKAKELLAEARRSGMATRLVATPRAWDEEARRIAACRRGARSTASAAAKAAAKGAAMEGGMEVAAMTMGEVASLL